MQYVASLISENEFQFLANRLVNELYGVWKHSEFQDSKSYEQVDQLRQEVAGEITADHVLRLHLYEIGQDKVEPVLYARLEAAETVEERNTAHDALRKVGDVKLAEAYRVLVDEGEETFKERYEPKIGIVETEDGHLKYDHQRMMNEWFAELQQGKNDGR